MYYAGDEYKDQKEKMEFEFMEWNLDMRLALESYFRFQYIFSIAFFIQSF